MMYFTSDYHFNHANIIKYCNRPFKSIEEMNNVLIEETNNLVKEDDTLICGGDFCFGSVQQFKDRINCKNIIMIKGNHDKNSIKNYFETHKIYSVDEFTICHYPWGAGPKKEIIELGQFWDNYIIYLYGHCHTNIEKESDRLFPYRRSMDIGVDNIYRLFGKYRPISKLEVLDYLGE